MEDKKIKVLWLCNFMPSFISSRLGISGTNKEGWISGMAAKVLEHGDISLAVAFPSVTSEKTKGETENIKYYGFVEDTLHPEEYDDSLETGLREICDDFCPDVIHCFGTEYPHTAALLNIDEYSKKALIHLQGLMEPYSDAYYTGLPVSVIRRNTFRDIVRNDGIMKQKEKYISRSVFEKQVLRKASHVCGRTDFDRSYMQTINPGAKYYRLNETLRTEFYEGCHDPEKACPHSIFVSQGNYPLKGIHFAVKALIEVVKYFPDVKMYVAGDNIIKYVTLKDKIKISSYGKYIRDLIVRNGLDDNVEYVGQKNASQMKEMYMRSSMFLIPSVLENSPNSLGEAMLLGMPCVCARVGGIPSMTDEDACLMYEVDDVPHLAECILKVFENRELANRLSGNARKRALINHDREMNYASMLDIYHGVAGDKI